MAASVHAADGSSDKAGTNPVNFTHDVRLYNEFLWLNTKGDGEQNITTLYDNDRPWIEFLDGSGPCLFSEGWKDSYPMFPRIGRICHVMVCSEQ